MNLTTPPEAHSHGSHAPTGRKWLDVALGVGAIAISLFSALMTLQHGHAMEKMVDQNARMVQASTWPYVTIADSNGDSHGHKLYEIMVFNNGVGPAKVETLDLYYRGQHVKDAFDLASRIAKQAEITDRPAIITSGIGGVIPARNSITIISLRMPTSSRTAYQGFQPSAGGHRR